jgi:hypothetical protein
MEAGPMLSEHELEALEAERNLAKREAVQQ